MVAIDPGFLEKIFADPADDNHRLAVCDWLTENGDPARAELIQLQCEKGTGAYAGWSEQEIHDRVAVLEGLHRERWLTEAGIPEELWQHVFFERGMPSHYVTVTNYRQYDGHEPNRNYHAAQGRPEERVHAAELIAQLSPHTVPAALPSIVAGKEAIYLEVTESNILTHEVVLGDLTSEYRPTAFIGTAEHPAVVEAVVVAPNLDIDLRFGRCRSCMLQTGARNTGRLYIDNSRIDSVIIGPEHSGFIEGGFASDFGRVLIGHGKNNGLVLNGTAGAVVTGPGYQDVLTLCSYTRTALHSHDATGSLTLGLMEFSQPDAEFAFYNHETGETHPITLRGTYYGKEGGEQVLKMVYNDTLALGSLLIMQDAHGSDERSIAASVPENIINRTREKGRKDRTAAAVTSLGEATGDLGDLSKERVEKGPPPRP